MRESGFHSERAGAQPEDELKEKTRLIVLRFIEKHIIGRNESLDKKEEQEIREHYQKLSHREKADALYNKMMAYMVDMQAEGRRKIEIKDQGKQFEPKKIDPYFISEIKILSSDPAVQELISSIYGEARMDAKKLRISELGNLWKETVQDISEKESRYKQFEQQLHLGKVSGRSAISAAKSRMALLAENLIGLEQRKNNMETLAGFPKIPENTDAVAGFQYRNLTEYKKQLEQGFVWLPSRKEIHRQVVGAILNHRWPVLIGEAGSGKSDQADAAAIELTGHPPTEIECESMTGEKQLIGDTAIDPKTGGSYTAYGPLMSAFTGHKDSREQGPVFSSGRIVRFDESGRLGPRAYSIVKKARQKAEGDDFYGHPVLPGSGAIWTSNPVGPRYPDRHAPDPAMRRELAEIRIDYPPMSFESPELYEFALTALFDENNHIAAAKEELSPAYEKKDIPADQREVLEDGSIVIAKDEIIKDMSDARHGALWRFCGAIKSLQDSFVYGNAETEKYPDTLLRFKEDADGNIAITTDGTGEPLILFTSTVTLGELASWMSGFNERLQKQGEEFRTKTLTEWFDFKIKTYLKQADKADKVKIEAIFKYFHFLENSVPDVSRAKPLIPKEIGYLSPRVPRPLYLEKPEIEARVKEGEEIKKEKAEKYETVQVLLESGERVLIKVSEFVLEKGRFDLKAKKLVPKTIPVGEQFSLGGKQFSLAGVLEDGKPIGQPAGGEKLYKIFSPEELDSGIMKYFQKSLEQEFKETKEDAEDFCKSNVG